MNVLGSGTLGALDGLPKTNIIASPIRVIARIASAVSTAIIQSTGSVRNAPRIKGANGSIAFSVISAKIKTIALIKGTTASSTVSASGTVKSISRVLDASISSLISSQGKTVSLPRMNGAILIDLAVAIIPGIIRNLTVLKNANATIITSSSGTIRSIAKVFNYRIVTAGIEKIYLALR